jgi:hypothetical protein
MGSGDDFPDVRRVSISAGLGALLVVVAWLIPAHWKSLSPPVVAEAGRETQSLGDLGLAAVAAERPGPAGIILAAAQSTRDPKAGTLAAALAELGARKPELTPWGGNDRLLESIFGQRARSSRTNAVPVLHLLLSESSRTVLLRHLSDSRSPGVIAILQTRDLTNTSRFVPALRPGGQPFDACILLMGLLYDGEHFPPSLAQEIKTLADKANATRAAGDWENACLDLLSLGNHLNWTQLGELLRAVPDRRTLAGLARHSMAEPDRFPMVYSASLMTQSPEEVVTYLERYGREGGDYLALALSHGQGAVRMLMARQLPVGPAVPKAANVAAAFVLRSPELALALKMVCFGLALGCFYLVWNALSAVESTEGLSALSGVFRRRRLVVAAVIAIVVAAASEPFLLPNSAAPTAQPQPQFRVRVLSNAPVPKTQNSNLRSPSMNLDMSTIISVALFAALQVIVYAICLIKIREISVQPASAQLKLKLMENEENLFDSGLYVGIAGTAAALILQVLGIIEANLLAAYSSNLFGILCVALVKIRHVRAFKRKLILQTQMAPGTSQPVAQAVA